MIGTRASDEPHGRQHAAVHRDGGRGLKETFGSDGQPGSYTDVDHCDALFLVGHNVAETQTVLWMRMLDRLEGPTRRAGRRGPAADTRPRRADVHLAIRSGTNLALLNALLHELIANGRVDEDFVDAHTVGFDELPRPTSSDYTPERVAEICGVPADDIRAAARSSARPSASSRPCSRASTSPTRPPPRPARSTTSTCSAA